MSMFTNLKKDELMIDSGTATHLCPIWFASTTQTYDIPEHERPNLRTATEDPIEIYGCKWAYMTKESNQQIVIPFCVCSVSQPILSVTRLTEQGFTIHLSEQPTITHPNGFEARLRAKEGTYFLPVSNTGNTIQLQAWRTRRTTRHQSNNITHHIDTRRSTMRDTPTPARHLDIQPSSIPGETPQSQAQSNVRDRPTLSSSDGQAWGLQKNNRPQTRRHNRRLRGETSQPCSTANRRGCWTQNEKVKHGSKLRRMREHQSHRLQHRQHQTRHYQHPISNSRNKRNRRGDTRKRSQRGQRRWQQAMSNSQAVNSNHTQQQAFHGQRSFQQRKTIGSVKDICGKEST